MLSYYSYYSVGGYKDMYLGNSEMKEKDVFFLPLLALWEKRAATNHDSELMEKVKTLAALPSIKILNQQETYGLPARADRIFSHGGYKVIYVAYKSGESILAVRNIEGSEKDESGRTIPFLLAIAGTTANDKKTLGKLAAYIAANLQTASKQFASLFEYDPEKNGICFHLSALNAWVQQISNSAVSSILTICGEYAIDPRLTDAAWVIVPEGLNRKVAVEEQKLQDMQVTDISLETVIPRDDNQRLLAMIKPLLAARKRKRMRQLMMWGGVGVALSVGIAIGYGLACVIK